MRVIAGTARSMPLKTIEGLETRPTTDRIKETLFNILTRYVPQAKFLDLFAEVSESRHYPAGQRAVPLSSRQKMQPHVLKII